MNEQRFAYLVRQALDESAERLPYRVTQRLERARLAALSQDLKLAPLPDIVYSAASPRAFGGSPQPSLWLRTLSVLLPLLIVAAGLYGIAIWSEVEDAADTADIDAALVLGGDDDVPVSALADKGFGVFLRNTRQ